MKLLRLNVKSAFLSLIVGMIAGVCVLAPIAAQAGIRDGAGSDGDRDASGRLRLGELIRKSGDAKRVQEKDKVQFLKSIPGFETLIAEIVEVHPALALAILDQLLDCRIWLIPNRLPPLPEGVTSISGRKADTQIAVRYGPDIIISEPSLKEVTQPATPEKGGLDGAYTMSHEALHGLIPGEGPIHHEFVKAVNLHLFEMRGGRLERGSLDEVLKENDVRVEAVTPEVASRLKVVLKGKSEDPYVCAMFRAISTGWSGPVPFFMGYHRGLKMVSTRWSGLEQCSQDAFYRVLEKEAPALFKYMVSDRSGYLYSLTLYPLKRPSWYANADDKRRFQEYCSRYGSEDTRKSIEDLLARFGQAISTIDAAWSEVKAIRESNTEDSRTTFLKSILEMEAIMFEKSKGLLDHYLQSAKGLEGQRKKYETAVQEVLEKKPVYEQNRRTCGN